MKNNIFVNEYDPVLGNLDGKRRLGIMLRRIS